MRNEENMISFDIEFFRTCNKQITCKFCILQNKLVDHIDMDLYSKKRRHLLDILKKDIKTAVENNSKINHVNIHFSGGDFANVEDMVQYTIFLKELIEYCKGLNLKLESYLTTNLLYIDKEGREWKYEDMDELIEISNVFTMTTHVNTSYSPEGRFNTAKEVVVWITNLLSYNYLRSLYKKEPINVIIPLTKAVVKYNHNNKVRGMLKRLYKKNVNDDIFGFTILDGKGKPYLELKCHNDMLDLLKFIINKGIYSFLREQNIPYTFTPFMSHVLSEKSTEDNTIILYNKEYSDNEKYYKSDTYYHELQDFLLTHVVGYSIGTEQLFRDNQFSSCMYNGNIKCYTLDGEVVKCLIDQNCTKKLGHGPLCCNLIADTEHLTRKIAQIENNIREEIAKNEER